MRDWTKCIPAPTPPSSSPSPSSQNPDEPEPWNELAAFREVALRHFTRPEDEACLRRLGELLTESALEQAHLWPEMPGSETESLFRAALRDLLHTLDALTSLGDSRHLRNLPPLERTLAAIAGRMARHLRREAHTLQRALSRHRAELWLH
jgi:hypothetical protein